MNNTIIKINNRIEGLDLLRFAAAFIVLFYHYFFIGPLQGSWPASQFLDITHFGDFGVDVFFVISGLVITLSAEGRDFWQFSKARFIRIAPALFVCSLITAVTSAILPGTSASDIFTRWTASLTLFPQFFNKDFLSAVYWTLQVEVKFYVLVAILLAFGIWKFKYKFVQAWLILALANTFYIHNSLIDQIFLTEYAGHFSAGMLLYRIRKGEQSSFTPLGLVISSTLIWKHCVGFESWIDGYFHHAFSDIGTFLIAPFCIASVFWASGVKTVPISAKITSSLGAMSYTLYLIHADLGFFERMLLERWGFVKYPHLKVWLTDPVVVIFAIISSLILAAIVSIYLEPPLKNKLKKIFDLKFTSFKVVTNKKM